MKICVLASGSKGNCTYVSSGKTSVLIDCGLSLREVLRRLKLIGVDASNISGILVTHEHTDHTKGLETFANKFKNAKIYMHYNGFTAIAGKCRINVNQQAIFYSAPFSIGDITIYPFILPHDSICNVGFTLEQGGKRISYATDIGVLTDASIRNFYGSHLVVIESNHDEEMLMKNKKYSAQLKQRILSSRGHLSNEACGHAIAALTTHGTRQVILAHLSEENNSPIVAYESAKKVLASYGIEEGTNVAVDVAEQHKISKIFVLE